MTDPSPRDSADVDILIVGAGPVGMTLALALADGPWTVALADRRPRGAGRDDPRALALSHGTRQTLERLHAWDAGAGTPISDIHISQRGGFGRSQLDPADYGLPALGYVMRYGELAAGLDAALSRLRRPPQFLSSTQPVAREAGRHAIRVELAENGAQGDTSRPLNARLVIHAEGTPQDAADCTILDYRQHAVIAEVRPEAPHQGRAWERFTPDGPLALLPLGDAYAVVFTVPPAKAEALQQLNDTDFLAALSAQFGRTMRFTGCGPRSAWPLALRLRKQLVAERQAWIGNCAQTLHPVSGQGFNLGLRDSWELAETLLASADRHASSRGGSADPGDPAPLAAYARHRQPDRYASAAFTDGIVRLFSNDLAPLRAARGLGLLAIDMLPPLRHFIAKRMIWGARAWP